MRTTSTSTSSGTFAGVRPCRTSTSADGQSPAWVDFRSAAALTGVSRGELSWAMADGPVSCDTCRARHEGVLPPRPLHANRGI